MSGGSPRFSIVIPCYNQGAFLAECLASVRAQTLAPYEVIVVDDGSTDPWSAQRIRELCTPPVILVAQENRGLAGARNSGVRRATGDWILPLDADDQLTPDALASYAEAIARAPEVDVWYPDIQHFGLHANVYPYPDFNAWRLLSTNIVVGAGSAIRRGVFDAGVRYEERMRDGYEDWEFYVHACCDEDFRAQALGKPLLRYRRWGYSMLSSANEKQEELRRQIRQLRPVYRDEDRLLALKRRDSPFFSISAGPAVAAALENQHLRDWTVTDSAERAARDGDLSAFRGRIGRSLLVCLDDAALARCLGADRFLLDKIAVQLEATEASVAWLVTSHDVSEAYPGFPAQELDPSHASCVAFAVSTRFMLAAPLIGGGGPSFAADVARHMEAFAPGTQLALFVGARGSASEGIPLPEEARRPLAARDTPPPNWRISARERAMFLREAATRVAKAVVGRRRFERIERTSAYAAVRALARGESPRTREAAPTPPVLASGCRAGPLDAARLASPGYVDAVHAIAEEPARHPRQRPDGPSLLIAVPWIIHGGADRAVLDLLHGISRVAPQIQRHVVMSERARMTWADQLRPVADGVIALAGPPAGHAAQVCDWVERLGVDALLVVSCGAAYDALPEIRRLARRVRVAAQFHGFDRDRQTGELVGWPVYATSRYNNLIDEYAVISGYVADTIAGQYYVSPSKIRVVHLGIDVPRFAAARRQRLTGSPAHVLWLGRLAPEKDPAMAVHVAAAWKAKHGPDRLRLTIGGGGPLADEVRALVRSLHVEDVVTLAGPVDDPLPFYRDADAVLLTSRYEGIPVVVYEAMAAGLPIVTVHENTSIAEVLPRDRAWFVDRRDDPAAYVAQLEALLADPAGARAIADRNAMESAGYGVERYAREMLEVLLPGLDITSAGAAASR